MSERLSSPPMNSRPAKVKNERNMIPPSTLTKKTPRQKNGRQPKQNHKKKKHGVPEKKKTLPQGTPFFPRHRERRRGQMTALCVFEGVLRCFIKKNSGPVAPSQSRSPRHWTVVVLLSKLQQWNHNMALRHPPWARFFAIFWVGKACKLNTKKRWKIGVGGYFRRGVFGRWGFA